MGENAIIIVIYKMHFSVGFFSLHTRASKRNIVFPHQEKKVSSNVSKESTEIFTLIFLVLDTVWKNEKFTLTEKIFREINQVSMYFRVKILLSWNFCQKSVRVNLCNFHTVWERISRFSTHKNRKFFLTGKYFTKSPLQ